MKTTNTMTILQTPGWNEYALLDTGEGKRLEQFGQYRLIRPDPQIIWQRKLPRSEWDVADAVFMSGEKGKQGKWQKKSSMPDEWKVHYQEITFKAKLTPFKHTGIFPEQSLHWEWMSERIRNYELGIMHKNGGEKLKILNLFAYTGGASLICAGAGAEVTHVDASKPSIAWARENQQLSGLNQKPIRWIYEDVMSFVKREVKRGKVYDGIIMDPPVYGHGPSGERWEFNENFPELIHFCKLLLSPNPLFILINAYAISSSALMLGNSLADITGLLKGKIEVGELALEEKTSKRLLSTGIYARFD